MNNSLFNENNLRNIIDNAFYAWSSCTDDFDADDIISEIRDTIGDFAFDELINYDEVIAIIEGKFAEYEENK